MVKKINRLSARTVASLTKPGRHADGGGLYLRVAPSGAKRWVFMWQRGSGAEKAQREAGLGSVNAVPLAKAREIAAGFRAALADGLDPLEARRKARSAQEARKTFGAVAELFLAAKACGWRNAKHRAQWRMTLEIYAAPLWPMPAAEVATIDVLAVLQPIWHGKPETASRLRGRIEAVLDAARVAGHIPADRQNPARWKGHLEKILPPAKKLSRGHHPAMPYHEVPAFVRSLRGQNGMAARALEFLILTAARTGEVTGARWLEIDAGAKVWTVPAARMKAGREHRVPLSGQAIAILENLASHETGDFVFPGHTHAKPLSNMAFEMLLRRMKIEGVTTHGFRSSFRDWAGDKTAFPREIAEAALAHVAGDATEQAYRRGDALEKRRALMGAWGAFCAPRAAARP
ncbi:MAG: tyrosine-type recombinase/integrase [Methylocella sp.]